MEINGAVKRWVFWAFLLLVLGSFFWTDVAVSKNPIYRMWDIFLTIFFYAAAILFLLCGVRAASRQNRKAKRFARIFSALPNPPKAADKEGWRRDVQAYVRSEMTRRAVAVRVDCDCQERAQQEAKKEILPQLGLQAASQSRKYRARLRENTKLVEGSKKRFEEAKELALFFGYKVERHWTDYIEEEESVA